MNLEEMKKINAVLGPLYHYIAPAPMDGFDELPSIYDVTPKGAASEAEWEHYRAAKAAICEVIRELKSLYDYYYDKEYPRAGYGMQDLSELFATLANR